MSASKRNSRFEVQGDVWEPTGAVAPVPGGVVPQGEPNDREARLLLRVEEPAVRSVGTAPGSGGGVVVAPGPKPTFYESGSSKSA